jgi:acyl carrier protein
MNISSRTPEGEPNCCPVCGKTTLIEPSSPVLDAPCPSCGTLLWFVKSGNGPRIYSNEQMLEIRDQLIVAFTGLADAPHSSLTSALEAVGADSLDYIELVMELEESLGPMLRDLPLKELIERLLRRRL